MHAALFDFFYPTIMYVYNLININLLFQLSELIHWKSGGSPVDWGLVIFFPFSLFRTIRSPTEVQRKSNDFLLQGDFTGLSPDLDRTGSRIWSSPMESIGSLTDCPLGPSELAGSSESPSEKGGECKVHRRSHIWPWQ